MTKKINTNIPLAQQVISICKDKQLKHIVISPGSRNAPLTIGFTNDPYFSCYSIVDERCAAFFALGIAQQNREPVAIVCTSGSALLNYYPAIAEAFYSDIPLVVLSADRPKEHIDIGDGQTIRQEQVFANHILFEANLSNKFNYSEHLKIHNAGLIEKALLVSIGQQGPVHVNIPLYEPLYETIEQEIESVYVSSKIEIKEAVIINELFIKEWNKSSKKLVLVGVLPPNSIDELILDQLMEDPSVLLFTETTSNIHHHKAIPSIDQLISKLSDDQFKELQPELLLTFGGLVVSKRIKAFLRKYSPNNHWHVDIKKAYNTYGCLTEHIKATPNEFLKLLLHNISAEANASYQKDWLKVYTQKLINHDKYLASAPYSDLKVFEAIITKLPTKLQLQLSNSSTIRYIQLFRLPKGVAVFCNRGTSGIDGSTSTAIGAALINKKPTILITGDLSFFYDSNALWNNYIPKNFKIIVINNNGGGIFRILPADKQADYFDAFLETTHNLKAEHLAKMYGFNYQFTDGSNLEVCLEAFFESDHNEILEIETPRLVNDRVLLNYFC